MKIICTDKILKSGVVTSFFASESGAKLDRGVVHKGRAITRLTSIFANDNITPLLKQA